MGNALRFLYGHCCKPSADSDSLGHHGVTHTTVGVSALAHDLYNFEITSQVILIYVCLYCSFNLNFLFCSEECELSFYQLLNWGPKHNFQAILRSGLFSFSWILYKIINFVCVFSRFLKDWVSMLSHPRRLKLSGKTSLSNFVVYTSSNYQY